MAQRLVAQRLSRSLALARCRGGGHCPTRTATPPHYQLLVWIHSTRVIRNNEDTLAITKDTDTTTTTSSSIESSQDNNNNNSNSNSNNNNDEEDNDECPVWQNPLHHNNPELEKMFPEDFAEDEVMPLVPLPPLARPGSRVQAPPHVHELCDEIVQLNLLEMKQLMDKVANHFGFDPHTIAMGLVGGRGSGSGNAAANEDAPVAEAAVVEKTTFDLKLIGFDAKNKIKVIKEVRAAIAGLGLKEAKELVESAPTVIQKDMKKEAAEELQKKLEDIGATMELV